MARGRGWQEGRSNAMDQALKARYQIEDLVGQDGTGAVYCARDAETDRLVAVRRFFPMGISGGGFVAEEQEGFGKTVEALKEVRHEALRGVLDGGVDEVDGMPYLVTEWEAGRNLSEVLEEGPLQAEEAIVLASKGLELLALLCEQFGEGADWIEMEPDTVVVAADDNRFTFWICPFQWLGVADRDGGVRGLAHLVEHAMGWGDRLVPAAAAAGLGGWVASAKEQRWTIAEAERELGKIRSLWTGEVVEEALPDDAGPAPVQAPGPVVQPAPAVASSGPLVSQAPVVRSPGRGGLQVVLVAVGVLVALIGIAWAAIALSGREREVQVKSASKPPARVVKIEPQVAPPDNGLTRQEQVDQHLKKAAEAMRIAEEGGQDEEPDETEVQEPGPSKTGMFGPDDGAAMREWVGSTQHLQGRLFRVRDSDSGETRYLEFSDKTGKDDVCCRFWARDREGMRLEDLKKLEGKVLRFMGLVTRERGTGRIVLHLDHPGQIEVIE